MHTSYFQPSAATDGASGSVPSIVGAATEFGALSDNSDTSFIAIASGYSSRRYPCVDLSGVPSDAAIDFVQPAAKWAMTASGQLHFALRLSVSNVEYPDPTGQGPAGDTWKGSYVPLAWRYGAKHGKTPQNTDWTIADVNAAKLRYHLYADNTSGNMWLTEMWGIVGWYAAPTISGAIAGMADPSQQRVTWAFHGDGIAQAKYAIKVFSDAQVNRPGFDPAVDRWYWFSGVQSGSATGFTLAAPSDGIWHVYVWAAAHLPVSGRDQWTATPLHCVATFDRSPNAPTLTAPTNGAHFDSGLGVEFDWSYSHPDPNVAQSGWQLELTTDAPPVKFWNEATGLWQAGAVTNSGAQTSKVFAAGALPSGHTYTWRVRVVDADGDLSAWSQPASFIGDTPPSMSIDEPSGTLTTTDAPGIAWTFTDPNGDLQELYDVRIFTSDQAADPSFDPLTATPLWASGIIASAMDNAVPAIPIDLPNDTAYVVYGRVQARGMWSTWANSNFDVALATPAQPTITCTEDRAGSRLLVAVQGHDNLLTLQDSSFEDPASIGNWTTGTGLASTTLDTTLAKSGIGSLKLVTSSSASASCGCGNSSGTVYAPVTPGDMYTAMASFYAPASADRRSVWVTIRWFNAAKTFLSSTTGTASATIPAATWTQAVVSGAAPAGAAYASIVVNLGAGSAVSNVYVDEAALMPGASLTAWSAGGFLGSSQIVVEYSDDFGLTWSTLRGGGALVVDGRQQCAIYDYECPPQWARYYRARSVGVLSNQRISSLPSPVGGAASAPTSWWLKDPLYPSRNRAVRVLPEFSAATKLAATPFETKGADFAVVIGEVEQRGETFTASVWALDVTQHLALLRLLRSGNVLLLQDVIAQQWYVRCTGEITRERLRAYDPVTQVAHAHKVTVTFTQVARPDDEPVEDVTP